ncbi:MAG: hypothetical protein KIS92_02025 [Planctomycetota bacterium]|nr:hypothetical protein [Planctomycetota bacterium]
MNRTITVALLAWGMLAGAAAWAEDLFVVGDAYGIKPDGTCFEVTGGDFGPRKQKNLHWDAATKTIKLYGAKNEDVAVQVVIPQAGKGFAAKMSDLKGPSTIPAERASFGVLAYVNHVKAGLGPDLIVPLDGSVKGITRFDIPLSFEGLPKPDNKVGVLFFEVWIPKDAQAGLHKGTLHVMEGEKELAALNLELTVFGFALPDAPTYAFDLLDYGMPSEKFGATAYLNGNGLGQPAVKTPEKSKQIDLQVFKLAADHRCFVNVLPYHSQRGNPKYCAPVEGSGEKARVMSWEEWDDRFGDILNGKANKFGAPPAHFTLGFNINYPYNCESDPNKQFDFRPFKTTIPDGPGKNAKLKVFEDSYKAIAEQYITHIAEKGWTRTRFELYSNQKPSGFGGRGERNTSPWKLDEPTDGPDYMGLGYLFNVNRWAFAGAKEKNVQVVNRIDIGHWHCSTFLKADGKPTGCVKDKAYDRDHADKYLKGAVDHWVINWGHINGAQHQIKDYEGPGIKMMTYGTTGNDEIASSYVGCQSRGYVHARMGLVGQIMFKLGLDSADPNKQESGGLADNCVYSGATMGFSGALPSHRLKLWRNSVNDYEYILLARAKNAEAADAVVKKMTSIGQSGGDAPFREFHFTNNPEDLTAAKVKLAEIVAGPVNKEIEIQGPSKDYTGGPSEDQITNFD